MSDTVLRCVERTVGSGGEARRAITQALGEWGLGHLTRQAVIVGHELVANAVRHGVPPIQLRITRRAAYVVIEVFDGSDTLPRIAEIDNATSPSGRGMRIVTSLTRGWGVRLHRHGKTVWAEITAAGQADGQTGARSDR